MGMKKISDLCIMVAVISLVVAVISRFALKPVVGIFANSILEFAGVCLLLSIAVSLREK